MIRSARLGRLAASRKLVRQSRRVSTSTAAVESDPRADQDPDRSNSAGPSRIHDHRHSASSDGASSSSRSNHPLPSPRHQHASTSRPTGHGRPDSHLHIYENLLAKLRRGSTIDPDEVETLLNGYSASGRSPVGDLTVPQINTLVGALVHRKLFLLAAGVMLESLRVRAQHGAENNENMLFDRLLVGRVFRWATLPPGDPGDRETELRMTSRGTDDLNILLPLLSALQDTRAPRPEVIYQYMMERLVGEKMYDTGAKIYVGLVEEWITIGRIGEGADPQAFYPGGGPPRHHQTDWERSSGVYKLWWKGVRTWTLPEEVLSPHDRLDLWHPRKLRIPERLRRFPFPVPTSPPSHVPYPTMTHLAILLENLELRPDETSLISFQRSMRACAILASTILSRTMPYLPAKLLREVLDSTPLHPPVYPEGMEEPAEGDESAWAYTAHTHIHLAIRSVLLSPPTVPDLFKYMLDFDKAVAEDKPLPKLPPSYRYQTAPLNFPACIFLIQYGLRRLRHVGSIREMVRFTQRVFSKAQTADLYNVLLTGFTNIGAHRLAQQVEKVLFGKTKLAALAVTSPVRSPPRNPDLAPPFDKPVPIEDRDFKPMKRVEPDVESLMALLKHMIATKQYDRFISTVYRIIPFLQHSKSRPYGDFYYEHEGLFPGKDSEGSATAALSPSTTAPLHKADNRLVKDADPQSKDIAPHLHLQGQGELPLKRVFPPRERLVSPRAERLARKRLEELVRPRFDRTIRPPRGKLARLRFERFVKLRSQRSVPLRAQDFLRPPFKRFVRPLPRWFVSPDSGRFIRGRGHGPAPVAMSPKVYGLIIDGLRQMRATNLADRVFQAALSMEYKWRVSLLPEERSLPENQIGSRFFSTMMLVWEYEEDRFRRVEAGQLKPPTTWNWRIPKRLMKYPRRVVASLMIWSMYCKARTRWRRAAWDWATDQYVPRLAGGYAPDAVFFNIIIQCRSLLWELRSGYDWHIALTQSLPLSAQRERSELQLLANDMRETGFEVPLAILIKLGAVSPLSPAQVRAMSPHEIRSHTRVKDVPRQRNKDLKTDDTNSPVFMGAEKPPTVKYESRLRTFGDAGAARSQLEEALRRAQSSQ